jgi:hypothetical protein
VSGFFFLQFLDRHDAPVAYGRVDPSRDQLLAEPGYVRRWTALELVVRTTDLTDYLPNNVGVRLCSRRLRDVLDLRRSGEDEVQWLEAVVVDASGRTHDYYVLHLPSHPDVLDEARTIRVGRDFVVKPVISRGQARNHCVFSFPGAAIRLIVADEVKVAIERARCTGVTFEAVASA